MPVSSRNGFRTCLNAPSSDFGSSPPLHTATTETLPPMWPNDGAAAPVPPELPGAPPDAAGPPPALAPGPAGLVSGPAAQPGPPPPPQTRGGPDNAPPPET